MVEADLGIDKMIIDTYQGVLENKIMEEALEIHIKMVNEVQDNTHNLAEMVVKETKDNFCKIEEMIIDQDQETGEMVISLNVFGVGVYFVIIWGRLHQIKILSVDEVEQERRCKCVCCNYKEHNVRLCKTDYIKSDEDWLMRQ